MTKGLPWVYRTAWDTTVPTSKKAMSTAVCYGNVLKFNVAGRIVGFRMYSQSVNNPFGWLMWITSRGGVGRIEKALCFETKYTLAKTPAGDYWYYRYFRSFLRVDTTVYYQICLLNVLPGMQISYTPSVMTADITGTYITSVRNGVSTGGYAVNNGIGTAATPMRPSVNDSDSRYGLDVLFLDDAQVTP